MIQNTQPAFLSKLHAAVTVILIIGLGAVAPGFGQVILEDVKLLASDGQDQDRFGTAIALSNGIVVVGAFGDDDNGDLSGTAFLFDASMGTQIAKLLPNDGAPDDQFGYSVSIGGGLAAIGATQATNDSEFHTGAAYLFDTATGVQVAKLLPSDGEAWDHFGWSIAIDHGLVAVGSPQHGSGAVYVFDAATGVQIAKLLPNYDAGVLWGRAVALDNGIVAVGAVSDDTNGIRAGAVYVFDATTGVQIAKLLPNDGAEENRFGHSIGIANGVVAVGAYWDDDNGTRSGSAYLFDAFSGAQLAKLLSSDGEANDRFGDSIAIGDQFVAVGTYDDDDNGPNSGSVYLFEVSTGSQAGKLIASDGVSFDYFGGSVSIDDGVVVAGASGDDDNGHLSGSAYVIGINCPADITNDGLVNTQDFLAFLNAWATGEPLANWNIDGTINTLDFIAYLNAWADGCP